MKIYNFGSLNIDRVYRVKKIVAPGETTASADFREFPGGKGCNQSIALSRAGADVVHAGCIGSEGAFLKKLLDSEGVDTRNIKTLPDVPTGHAVIQVSDSGENSIVIFGGANRHISRSLIASVFGNATRECTLLLQNEISMLPEIIEAASERGMKICFNPSPMDDSVFECDLKKISLFILNEHEGAALSGAETGQPDEIIKLLRGKYPDSDFLLTLGARGAMFAGKNSGIARVPAVRPERIADTTAAGDTFAGYFIAGLAAGKSAAESMREAAAAAAICVSRRGAGVSIPKRCEIEDK